MVLTFQRMNILQIKRIKFACICYIVIIKYIIVVRFFLNMQAKSIIIPVLKKGDASDPKNYRGITLVSCFCKLFSSTLNKFLLTWFDSNNVITDAKFGYHPQRGKAEAKFSLSTIINMSLQKKKGDVVVQILRKNLIQLNQSNFEKKNVVLVLQVNCLVLKGLSTKI